MKPLREHIELAKVILKGEWWAFAQIELFVEISYHPDYEKMLDKNGSHEKYIKRTIQAAKKEITTSKNWPENPVF